MNVNIVLILAVVAGICTGSNYYNQPLIATIAHSLQITESAASSIIICAQLSYAFGLIFIAPLADLLNHKKLVTVLMLLSSSGLIICGLSNHLSNLIIGTLLIGFFSVVAQMMVSISTTLVSPQDTGKAMSMIISGLLFGALLARTIAGISAYYFDWRLIYLVSGILILIITPLIYQKLPETITQKQSIPQYFKKISNIPYLLLAHRVLRNRAAIGALTFSSLSMIFATMSITLTKAPFNLTDLEVGCLGLIGFIGVVFSNISGKAADKGMAHFMSITASLLTLLAWLLIYHLFISIYFYIIGLILMYASFSILHTTNQNFVFKIDHKIKAQLNGIYMTLYFIGAAFGSFLGVRVLSHWDWHILSIVGIFISLIIIFMTYLDYKQTKRCSLNTYS